MNKRKFEKSRRPLFRVLVQEFASPKQRMIPPTRL
jgi:hypothetical protein